LYATGNFGAASDGVEFRHTNATQGIGFGYNSIYAAGTNANQNLNLMPKGTGNVGIGTAAPQAKLHVGGISGTDGIMFPDGTVQTTAVSFGGWQSTDNRGAALNKNKVYQAQSDGILVAYSECYDGESQSGTGLIIKSNSSNPPTTVRAKITGWAYSHSADGTLFCPIKKGDYLKVENSKYVLSKMYWMPFGTSPLKYISG
jgi:hypothetical protein